MPTPLERIEEERTRAQNAELTGAEHDYNWANTFRSTPPVNVLRAKTNYEDAIERTYRNKLELEAKSDIHKLRLLDATAQYEQRKTMQPLQEELIKSRIAATGATERRRAEEAAMIAQDTAVLNTGISELYKQGIRRGTPEYDEAVTGIIAKAPHADPRHIMEVGKFIEGETSEQKIANAVRMARETTKAREEEKRVGRLTPEQEIEQAGKIAEERAKGTVRGSAGKVTVPKPEKLGTETVTEKVGDTTISTSRPLAASGSPEEKNRLLEVHGKLMAGLNAKRGSKDPSEEEIKNINIIRDKLGFQQLDSKGTAIPGTEKTTVSETVTDKPFSDEAAARSAGKKTGDIIIVISPTTGKPVKARLD